MSVSHSCVSRGLKFFYRATMVDMGHYFLLEITHVLLQLFENGGKFSVFAFEALNPLLQLGDLLKFLLPTFGGSHSVSRTLPFQLDHLLTVHIDGGKVCSARPTLPTFSLSSFCRRRGLHELLLQLQKYLSRNLFERTTHCKIGEKILPLLRALV